MTDTAPLKQSIHTLRRNAAHCTECGHWVAPGKNAQRTIHDTCAADREPYRLDQL